MFNHAPTTKDSKDTVITGTEVGTKRAQDVYLHGPTSIFGNFPVVQENPLVQIDALFGVLPIHETYTFATGSVSEYSDHGGKEFKLSTGTTIYGYGLLRSKRAVRYRPGQGVFYRFTARFPDGFIANGAQRAGAISSGTELSFGYHERADLNTSSEFGILWRTGGRLEVRTLTLSVAASGAETLTVTLNDVAYSVSVTSGTTSFNAFQIAGDTDFGSGKTWVAYQRENKVVFIAQSIGPLTGTYSVSSTGTLAGTFAQSQAGRAADDTWIYQSDWDNPYPFGEDTPVDPTKGNVYEIEFGYLGYSGIKFYMMSPKTNQFVLVHYIKYPNNYSVPHLNQPMLKVGAFAASLGSTTDFSVYMASGMGGIQGPRKPFRNPVGHSHTKTGVTTTLTSIISIQNRNEFGGFVNLAEILPQLVTVAVEGTKPAVIEIYINATLGGTPNWTYHAENSSICVYDTSATTVTGDNEVFVIALDKTGRQQVKLSDYDVYLTPGDILTIAAKATSGTTDVTVGLTWLED